MTPLAMSIAEELMKPLRFRRKPYNIPGASARMRHWLEHSHFFDVEDLVNGGHDLTHISDDQFEVLYRRYFFLPAPYTWLEMKDENGTVSAFLIMNIEKHDLAFYRQHDVSITDQAYRIFVIHPKGVYSFGTVEPPDPDVRINRQVYKVDEDFMRMIDDYSDRDLTKSIIKTLDWTLLLVNQPRLLGQQTHMAKAGFQRALASKLGGGSFPYKGWTQLTLKVHDPANWDDDVDLSAPREVHLSGRRAQHFVRKFSRIRLGKLEWVESHWRGDPSLGLKNTRYKVKMEDAEN